MSAQVLEYTPTQQSNARLALDDLQLDRRQSDAYRQWLALAKDDGGTPLRKSFRPERSSVSMPAGMLLHVRCDEAGGITLEQKIEGRLVSMAFGEGGGRNIDEIYETDFIAGFVPRLLETVLIGMPAMVRDVTTTAHGAEFPFTRLILPFREEGGGISRLFVVFGFDPHALSKLDEPLPVRLESARRTPFFDAPDRRIYA